MSMLDSKKARKKFPDVIIGEGTRIHKSAKIIGRNVRIGKNVYIGENVHIFNGVTIGDDVSIGKRTIIDIHTKIDNDVLIGNGTIINANAKIDNRVRISGDVIVFSGAHIQSGALIKSSAAINNDVVIGKDAIICRHSSFRDGAVIEKGGEGIVIFSQYKYGSSVYFDSRTEEIIVRLGCHHRTIEEWENDFDNNVNEFPIGSPQREARWQTFQFLKQWKPCFLQ